MIEQLAGSMMQALDLLGQALANQIAAKVDQLRLVCHLADLSGVVEGGARRGSNGSPRVVLTARPRWPSS